MNNIISQVTPLTRGILWFPKEHLDAASPTYQALDYLLDGLLTSTLGSGQAPSSQVLVGSSFNLPIYVFIGTDFKPAELDSYLKLVKPQLLADHDLLVIDDAEVFQSFRTKLPKDMVPQFRLL
jgi:hypothetical protein